VSVLVNLVVAGAAGLCLLVAWYFIYHYYWLRDRSFSNVAGFVLYIFLPLVLAALGLAALRLSIVWKSRIALFLFSSLVSALSVEIAIGIWRSLPTIVTETQIEEMAGIAARAGRGFDRRTVGKVLGDLHKSGIDAYPAAAPSALLRRQVDGTQRSKLDNGGELLPLGGVSNKTSVLCNEGLGYTIFDNDEHGFHNPKGLWRRGRVEVAVVGDSYVQGYCVPSENSFVAEIRKRYPVTLSVGSGGMGPLMSLAAVKEYLQFLRPKIVLWAYYEGNDARDLKVESGSSLLMRYLAGGYQGLIDRQPEIDRRLSAFLKGEMAKGRLAKLGEELVEELKDLEAGVEKLESAPKLSNLRDAAGLVFAQSTVEHRTGPIRYIGETSDLHSRILAQAKAQIAAWGGRVYFVYLPAWRPNWDAHEEDREIARIVSSLEIPMIDLRPAFRAHGDPLALFPFRMHNHYNIEGHRLVADEILRFIARDHR
jgi:hypothetical protein